MDSTVFDRWTRTLSHRVTRRRVQAFAPVGGLLAALGVGLGSEDVMAKKKTKKKKKKKEAAVPSATNLLPDILSLRLLLGRSDILLFRDVA